jgi:CHAT domain-containing protein
LFPSALLSKLKAKRLLIVSDGALQYLPFGALPMTEITDREVADAKFANGSQSRNRVEPLRPLIANYEIVTLPSASTLAVIRQEHVNRSRPAKSIAVIADPVFDEKDERILDKTVISEVVRDKTNSEQSQVLSNSQLLLRRAASLNSEFKTNAPANETIPITRLPFTRLEAENIVATAPAYLTLKATDFQANRQTATNSELANYRYVHFATHGILNSEHPELSGIVLSLVNEHGKPIDGFLRLHDIYNLNLPVDLVVLSACQTGLGKEIRGEGMIGLTRGFMYAGAPRVVASLWKVDDAATAELMKRFYTAMLKDNFLPAAALRRAKMEIWKQRRWQAPYYWAAFELQGDWR